MLFVSGKAKKKQQQKNVEWPTFEGKHFYECEK
jgi:hypothetical protein